MSLLSRFSITRVFDFVRHMGRKRHDAPHMILAKRGEDLAHRFAERELGWRVVARNYRHPMRKLEVDMVAVEGNTLVIVEVKSRASSEMNHPLRAVNRRKVWKVGHGAQAWIARAELFEMSVRFDVLTVIIGETERVEYHRDVYELAGRTPV